VQTEIRLQLLQSQEIAYSGAKHNFKCIICVFTTRKVSCDVTATSGKAGSTRVAAAELSAQSSYRATLKLIFFRLRCFFPGGKIALIFSEQTAPKKVGFVQI